MSAQLARRPALRVVFACVCIAFLQSACKPQNGSAIGNSSTTLSDREIVPLPLGDVAGTAKVAPSLEAVNPVEGNVAAIATGRKLFISMNCAGCHGYDGTGGMGPNLTDSYWRYGGTPSSIFDSIHQGRPQGMPAWGSAIPPQEIWKIVAFVQTLGGSLESDQYHAGMQGDHDVSSIASEVRNPPDGLNTINDSPTKIGDTSAPSAPRTP